MSPSYPSEDTSLLALNSPPATCASSLLPSSGPRGVLADDAGEPRPDLDGRDRSTCRAKSRDRRQLEVPQPGRLPCRTRSRATRTALRTVGSHRVAGGYESP